MLNPISTAIRFSTIPALIGIFTAALILSACKKPVAPDSVEAQKRVERFVVSTDGLIMRENPDKSARKIDLIKFGEKVNLISEGSETVFLSGEYGRWSQVTWNDKTGWVFGGYLRAYDVATLQKTAAEHYNKIWAEYCEKWFKNFRKGEKIPATISKFYHQTEKDITIKKIAGDYVVVTHWTSDTQGDVFSFSTNERRDDLWRYGNGEWNELSMVKRPFTPDPEVKNARIQLFYMNNDTNPDYIAYGGCCDSIEFHIMLGWDDGSFSVVKTLQGIDAGPQSYAISTDQCAKTLLRYKAEDGNERSCSFDCKTNKLVE